MKEKFTDWAPRDETLQLVTHAVQIIDTYAAEGFDLSLRQLYYQMVARDIIPNSVRSYKRLGTIIANARNAGLIDWDMIVDRGRSVDVNSHWRDPASIVRSAARSFAIDKWEDQEYRVLVMVEKDALSGVIRPVCEELDVEFSANKGYASQTHLYEVAKTMEKWSSGDQIPVVLYFGDFDPSGLDMDRDLEERLSMYSYLSIETKRLALTMEQIDDFKPPPNPAKMTDSRAEAYVIQHGYKSWELDAIEPRVLAELVRTNVLKYRDGELWDQAEYKEDGMRAELEEFANNYGK